jgi:outer membrane receptor protein involved in Fe transport
MNIGKVRSRGVILEAPWRLGRSWSVKPAYTYTNATIRANAAAPATVGNTLPDIPVHFASMSVGFDDERIATARLTGRWLSRRWGNDTHTQPLDEHFVMDFSISRRLTKALEVYFDAENFLDRRYTAWQLGGLPVLGEPLYVGLGARLRWR